MKITTFAVQGYRNLAPFTLAFHQGINILYGDNAQGKTNTVEAIHALSGVRSFRGAQDADLIGQGAQRTYIEATFESEGREQSVALYLHPKKRAYKNEIALKSPAKLCGSLLIVVFSPDHLDLIKGAPALRREFIDNTIRQLKPQYNRVLQDFGRVLTQRAALLRDIAKGNASTSLLDVWDDHFIRLTAMIMRTRQTYLALLEEPATGFYRGISGGRESLHFHYQPKIEIDTNLPDYKEGIAHAVKAARMEDIRRMSSTVGAHRDELYFEIDGLPARTHASQGQQRSAVLALKLAECEAIAAYAGEQPIVLLDDVMSELDAHRRRFLLTHIQDRQIFITCCEKELFAEMGDAALFHIANGNIQPIHPPPCTVSEKE